MQSRAFRGCNECAVDIHGRTCCQELSRRLAPVLRSAMKVLEKIDIGRNPRSGLPAYGELVGVYGFLVADDLARATDEKAEAIQDITACTRAS
jgi:hypothetical protein